MDNVKNISELDNKTVIGEHIKNLKISKNVDIVLTVGFTLLSGFGFYTSVTNNSLGLFVLAVCSGIFAFGHADGAYNKGIKINLLANRLEDDSNLDKVKKLSDTK